MKKVLLIIILCLSGLYAVSFVRLNMITENNSRLQNEIEKTTADKTSLEENNQTLKDDIEKTKTEKKDKWEELETWKNYQEKINSALTSS